MRTIHKYQIPIATTPFVLDMPAQARVISVQTQNGHGCMWAEVNDNLNKKARIFYVCGTGQPMPPSAHTYVGTFQTEGGLFVWHVYEAAQG